MLPSPSGAAEKSTQPTPKLPSETIPATRRQGDMQAIFRNRFEPNVGLLERTASIIGGSTLVAYGIGQRNWPGFGLAALGGALICRGATGHSYVYQALGIHRPGKVRSGVPYELGVRVDKAINIQKPPEEVYAFWRRLENLPHFMKYVESVTAVSETLSHWVVTTTRGGRYEWDAEIVNDEPNRVIGYRSLPHSKVDVGGSVRFEHAPGNSGTIVRVSLQYNPPGGFIGALIAKWIGASPDRLISEDLRRLKQLLETGEIASEQRRPARDTYAATRSNSKVDQTSEDSFPASDAPSWTPAGL